MPIPFFINLIVWLCLTAFNLQAIASYAVSLAEILENPVLVPNEVDNIVFHNSLQGKTFVLVPNEVDNIVFHNSLQGKTFVLVPNKVDSIVFHNSLQGKH